MDKMKRRMLMQKQPDLSTPAVRFTFRSVLVVHAAHSARRHRGAFSFFSVFIPSDCFGGEQQARNRGGRFATRFRVTLVGSTMPAYQIAYSPLATVVTFVGFALLSLLDNERAFRAALLANCRIGSSLRAKLLSGRRLSHRHSRPRMFSTISCTDKRDKTKNKNPKPNPSPIPVPHRRTLCVQRSSSTRAFSLSSRLGFGPLRDVIRQQHTPASFGAAPGVSRS